MDVHSQSPPTVFTIFSDHSTSENSHSVEQSALIIDCDELFTALICLQSAIFLRLLIPLRD